MQQKNITYNMKKFEEFIIEDACATLGNTGGMGAVVAAQPSSTPGDTNGGTPGSGDIGQSLGTYSKSEPNLKKKKKKKMKNLESFDNFMPIKEEIDNFTSRYYDNFDDEEEPANENDLQNINKDNLRKVQMYEKKKKK